MDTKRVKDFFYKYKEEVIVVFVFLIFAFAFNIYRVQGDGKLYYALLEKTLNISDPESTAGYLDLGFQQSGCSFFNIPFYLVGYFLEKLLPGGFNVNGITLRSIFINIASNFYLIISMFLTLSILKKMDLRYRVISVLSILFSTSAFTAAVILPSGNHAVDIFINTLFVYLVLSCGNKDLKKLFWMGAVYAVAMSIRYFNIILIIPPITLLLLRKDYKKVKYILFGILSMIWILPVLFCLYNGGIFNMASNLGTGIALKSAIINAPLYPKYALRLLVHPIHGIFVWSPVVILSALGLINMNAEKRGLGYVFLGIWALLVLINGFFLDWHAGWSFSNRYLVSLFPIYVIGLSSFLGKYGKRAVFLTVLGTCYSVFLFFNWFLCTINGTWGTPIEMVDFWTKGSSPVFSGNELNWKTFLRQIWSYCRYKYLFRIWS